MAGCIISPTLPRRGPSGLLSVEIRAPSPREALEAEVLRQAGARLDADLAEKERASAALDESLRLFEGMTDAERAELRFALRCDPELRAIIDGSSA